LKDQDGDDDDVNNKTMDLRKTGCSAEHLIVGPTKRVKKMINDLA
jgi:hypothetical protein